MRRGVALLATLPLLGAGLVAAPAVAGDDHYVAVRALDDRFTVVGEDCAGVSADQPVVKIGESDIHWRGRGSARVTAAAGTVGGLLVHEPHPLHGVQYIVWAASGDAPQARWRVEVNGDVLTSGPVDLTRDAWSRVWLSDAVLHGPDGWSGSIEDYITQFGHDGPYSAGLLTGPCLDSTEVRLDGIGTRHALFDFEPRTWVTVQVREDGPPYDGRLDAGDPFVVKAVAHRWDIRSDRAVVVPGADVALQRRWSGTRSWQTVAHAALWHGTAHRSASWRAVWRRPDGAIPSGASIQTSWAHASEPKVDGRRCRPDPDVLPFPPTCKTVLVDRGTVGFSGTGGPPRSVEVRVQVRTGGFDGPLLEQHTVVVGRDGRWRVAIETGQRDHLYVQVSTAATSARHELSGGRMRFPLEVR